MAFNKNLVRWPCMFYIWFLL